MWRSPGPGRGREVTCIACGESVPRSEAREYDKYGDRWDRRDKAFEYLCRPCDRELTDAEAAADEGAAFVSAYLALAEERGGSVEDR
jgi:hypothetical protein